VKIAGPDLSKSSTVATNGMVITTNACRGFSIVAHNSSSSDLWLLVFDRSTNAIPPDGSIPTLAPIKVAAGTQNFWDWNAVGHPFTRGIIVANSTTDRALTNSSANFWLTVDWAGKPN
jgi:hypothetical protein